MGRGRGFSEYTAALCAFDALAVVFVVVVVVVGVMGEGCEGAYACLSLWSFGVVRGGVGDDDGEVGTSWAHVGAWVRLWLGLGVAHVWSVRVRGVRTWDLRWWLVIVVV